MVLYPGSSLFYPWTLFTSSLVEISVIGLLVNLVFVPASLRYLERLWGSLELIKFIVVTIVASNIIGVGFNWIEYFVLQQDLFLHGMAYFGQTPLHIAILVAFTQAIPEHQIQIFMMFSARVKSLPMAYLTLSTVMTFLGYQSPWILIQFGWFVSWVYLRFYKKAHGDTVGVFYGDRSETFALVQWFPPFIHPVLGPAANFVHKSAWKFHLIPRNSNHDLESGVYNLVPGSARAEAERRRALALKALDQRLANSTPASSGGASAARHVPPGPSNNHQNGDASSKLSPVAPPSRPVEKQSREDTSSEEDEEEDVGDSKPSNTR